MAKVEKYKHISILSTISNSVKEDLEDILWQSQQNRSSGFYVRDGVMEVSNLKNKQEIMNILQALLTTLRIKKGEKSDSLISSNFITFQTISRKKASTTRKYDVVIKKISLIHTKLNSDD